MERIRRIVSGMEIGSKLTKLRAGRPYAEAARAAQCTPPTIRQIESGERPDPSYRIIARLARAYGVSLDWLADDEQEWPPPPATRDQKILDAVQQALEPFAKVEDLSPWEQEIIEELRKCVPKGSDAIEAVQSLVDAVVGVCAVWHTAHHAGALSVVRSLPPEGTPMPVKRRDEQSGLDEAVTEAVDEAVNEIAERRQRRPDRASG